MYYTWICLARPTIDFIPIDAKSVLGSPKSVLGPKAAFELPEEPKWTSDPSIEIISNALGRVPTYFYSRG